MAVRSAAAGRAGISVPMTDGNQPSPMRSAPGAHRLNRMACLKMHSYEPRPGPKLHEAGPDAERYPGGLSRPTELLRLAHAYRDAADVVAATGRPGDHFSRAPFRLIAIHAIERYLNAWLLQCGHTPAKVRSFQHDLGARADLATISGLELRKGTSKHLRDISDRREYLVTRYDTLMGPSLSQLNRLTATLADVSAKVSRAVPGVSPPAQKA